MNGLNESHQRRITITFRSVDEMLTEAVQLLDPMQAQSPFSENIPDATPVQHKVIADYAARTRARMREILQECGVKLPAPHISSIWAARTLFTSADIAVEELRPQYMTGFGELPEDTAKELETVVSEVLDLLTRMESFLAQGPGRDLRARLKRLESTSNIVPLLQELERIVTAHGLLSFRPTLTMLLERLESNRYEIAVFGRVSSGKSSLLNHILQTQVLPVGVTPVTAVPTRILYGPTPRAIVSFAEAAAQTIELNQLPAFATEQQNPSNQKHVTRIQVEVPVERLKDGISFVDTPGLGSLAETGTAESLAYLPRCDLGIVLVDASSTLLQEDLTLVNSLYQAGADAMVLLSKADMLLPDDQKRTIDYVQHQLQSNLGFAVPVYLVSVKGESAQLCDRWFDDVLVPQLKDHKAQAAASFQRKVGSLKENILATLKRRLSQDPRQSPNAQGRSPESNRGLSLSLMQLDAAKRDRADAIQSPAKLTDIILDQIAHGVARFWKEHPQTDCDAGSIALALATRATAQIAQDLARQLIQLRSELAQALKKSANSIESPSHPTPDLPAPTGLPTLDVSNLATTLQLHQPPLGFLGTGVQLHGIRKQLDEQLAEPLRHALLLHSQQLNEWRTHYLNQLRQSFTATADLHRQWPTEAGASKSNTLENETGTIRRDIENLERSANSESSANQPQSALGNASP